MSSHNDIIKSYPIGHLLDHFHDEYDDFALKYPSMSSNDIVKLAISTPGSGIFL
jgi:hypothetical protein